MDAPWRSLIYRNVDAPFDYVDDLTIFPHMPMNTPGFDCRVPRIMGDWMVSIPAKLARTGVNENATPDGVGGKPDNDPQPYVEVNPGDDGYDAAVAAAAQRLAAYRAGHRYNYCPDTTDIVDPVIVNAENQNLPILPDTDSVYDQTDQTTLVMPDIGVPLRAHWVVTDATDPPGAWSPRRPDWQDTVVAQMVGPTSGLNADDLENLRNVVAKLGDIKLTDDFRTALTTEVPFGLWRQKPGCDFSGVPTAGSYQGASRPRWMDVALPAADAPVYTQMPGAAVFNTICFNCHGPKADATGLLADEISIMTGGDARVANLRDGLFGPFSSPGANRQTAFSAAVTPSLTADDIGARYVAWMALGGTQKHLPLQLLNLVSNTPVFGQYRNGNYINPTGTPDMLKLGLELCTQILPANPSARQIRLDSFISRGEIDWSNQTALVDKNGDAEMWLQVCNLGNRPVVRVPYVTWSASTQASEINVLGSASLFWGDNYPASSPVMDQRGHVTNGLHPDNLFPLCIKKPSDSQELAYANQFLAAHPIGGPGGQVIPFCPPELFTAGSQLSAPIDSATSTYNYIDGKKWAARGAINAGVAVFLYLDKVERGLPTKPLYDQCEMR